MRTCRIDRCEPRYAGTKFTNRDTEGIRVSLTDMRNINNPAFQAERFVLLSDKSNLFYQGHTGLRSRTVTEMSIVLWLRRFPMKIQIQNLYCINNHHV